MQVFIYFLGILVLCLLAFFWFPKRSYLFGYFFLCRIPMLIALALFFLPILASFGPTKKILQSLFALDGLGLFWSTWLVIFTVWWIRLLWRIILCYAPDRYSISDLRKNLNYVKLSIRWGSCWLILIIPALIVLFANSEVSYLKTSVSMLAGILLSLVPIQVILVFSAIYHKPIDWMRDEGGLIDWFTKNTEEFRKRAKASKAVEKEAPKTVQIRSLETTSNDQDYANEAVTTRERVKRFLWEGYLDEYGKLKPGHFAMFATFFGLIFYFVLAGFFLLRPTRSLPALA